MTLCETWGKPLYEAMPHLIPWGYLTDVEIYLWDLHYRDKPRPAR